MVWEPFAIAVVFGLVVSAGLYFIVMWPQVEPADDDDEDVAAGVDVAAAAPAEPAAEPAAEPEPTDEADQASTDAPPR